MPTLAATLALDGIVATAPAAAATTAATPTLLPPPTIASPATVTPQPTRTLPAATPTGEPVTLLTLADFGDDRNPLTGLVVDPANLQRRPLAVKISNSPPNYVRPQSGLNDADLVFEHITEGFITRFTAIFYGTTPPDIGPIRSARLIDLEIPAMYDAALAFSGASVGVSRRLFASDFAERIIRSSAPGYYRTGANKPLEHTLYADPNGLWGWLDSSGLNVPPLFTANMAFSDIVPDGGQPAGRVTIDYRWEEVEWRYDPDSGRYFRWSGGVSHHDGNTGEQVNKANVIVVFAIHVEDPDICEEIRDGVCRHLSVQAQIWGSGSGLVLRDGQVFNVTWERLERSDMLTFYDAAGDPFTLKPGQSWVQVVPTYFSDPVVVTE